MFQHDIPSDDKRPDFSTANIRVRVSRTGFWISSKYSHLKIELMRGSVLTMRAFRHCGRISLKVGYTSLVCDRR